MFGPGIAELYGERYRGLVLLGSYARGEARGKDSDVDLLVLLADEVNGWQEYLKIEPVSWSLSLESGYVLSTFPMNAEAYKGSRKFHHERPQRRGNPHVSEVRAYLAKATGSFHEAGLLLAEGDADFAVSRAYYGCFYVAEAPLFDAGSNVSTHAGVIGEYGRIFAKTERLDRDFHKLLNRAFRTRQSADYDPDFDLDDVEVLSLSQKAKPSSTQPLAT